MPAATYEVPAEHQAFVQQWSPPRNPSPPPQLDSATLGETRFRSAIMAFHTAFDAWSPCEQLIALCSLVRKLPVPQAKFLDTVLQKELSPLPEIWARLEEQANDSECIRRACQERKQNMYAILLTYLPLLSPHATDAKRFYLSIIPQLTAYSLSCGEYTDECRQLISYLLIHPAITPEERISITALLNRLDQSTAERRAQAQERYMNGWSPNSGDDVFGDFPSTSVGQPGFAPPPPPPPPTGFAPITSMATSKPDFTKLTGSSTNEGQSLVTPLTPPLSSGSNPAPPPPLQVPTHFAPYLNPDGFYDFSPPSFTAMAQQELMSSVSSGAETLKPTRSYSLTPTSSESPPEAPALSSYGLDGPTWPRDGVSGYIWGLDSGSTDDFFPKSVRSKSVGEPSKSPTWNISRTKNTFVEPGSGMRDVSSWLKTLRLHKYAPLFSQLTYDEMLELDERALEHHGVTKGARHKIAVCVSKLNERLDNISDVEGWDLTNIDNLRRGLMVMRDVIVTPIRPFPPQGKPVSDQALIDGLDVPPDGLDPANLPAHITRLLGRLTAGLQTCPDVDDDACTTLVPILERALHHEAFTSAHKRCLTQWKQQCLRVFRQPKKQKPQSAAGTQPLWRESLPGEYPFTGLQPAPTTIPQTDGQTGGLSQLGSSPELKSFNDILADTYGMKAEVRTHRSISVPSDEVFLAPQSMGPVAPPVGPQPMYSWPSNQSNGLPQNGNVASTPMLPNPTLSNGAWAWDNLNLNSAMAGLTM